MSDPAGELRLDGRGRFYSGVQQAQVDFTVHWTSHHASLVSVEFPTGVAMSRPESWSLEGKLSDGRRIRGRDLLLSHLQVGEPSSHAEFTPLKGLTIGTQRQRPPRAVEYKLVGLYEGNLDCDIGGWHLRLVTPPSISRQTAHQSKSWQIPLEGLVLQISHDRATLAQYESKFRTVSKLLALATGNGVTAHRMTADYSAGDRFERWRHQTCEEIGPGPVVPSTNFESYLRQTLEALESWPASKQETAILAIDYINLSATGYLDTRLFQAMQVREFLARDWGDEGQLSEDVAALKKSVRHTYKQWKRAHQESDAHGVLGSRLSQAFSWESAKNAITCFALSRGINLSYLGVDLDVLKDSRDSVAHTGKLAERARHGAREPVDLLIRTQNAAQLLLLSEVGYQGNVYVKALQKREIKQLRSMHKDSTPPARPERGRTKRSS